MALRDMMPWGRRRQAMLPEALAGMRGLMETMERAWGDPWGETTSRLLGEWRPRFDFKETESKIVVSFDLPREMKKEDIHISASESALSVRGVQRLSSERASDSVERQTSRSFYRSFALPATVRADEVKASFHKDGVLRIELPKAKHSQVRRVKID